MPAVSLHRNFTTGKLLGLSFFDQFQTQDSSVASGNARLEDVSDFLAQRGILSRGGKRIHKTRGTFILSNPFYTGLFRYSKELHEGNYEPIIAKKTFDKVQELLKQRGRPHHKTKYEPQDLCGLMKCGTCGMSITGEYGVKRQKNGNTHD